MAPEQEAGQEVTARSDIYALGVVLHEVFTGKRPSADSSHPDLAPEVDRVIRRCLAEDPAMRPASALQVAATLPGGDPLAAALAAGETPSPEMVAAAGDTDSISVRTVGICVALILGGLVVAAVLGGKTNLLTKTPFPKAPAVLEQKAQDVIQGTPSRLLIARMVFFTRKTTIAMRRTRRSPPLIGRNSRKASRP